MRRRLLQLLTALSLLLALATAGLWGRSYWRSDLIDYRESKRIAANGSSGAWWLLTVRSQGGRIVTVVRVDDFAGGFPEKPRDDWVVELEHQGGLGLQAENALGYGIVRSVRPITETRQIGFGFLDVNVGRSTRTVIQFPHWFLVLLFSLLPAVRVIRWQVRRRRARQLGPDARPCPSCGYDRRASPTRCPECGHASDEAPATSS